MATPERRIPACQRSEGAQWMGSHITHSPILPRPRIPTVLLASSYPHSHRVLHVPHPPLIQHVERRREI